jgi:6-phosphogluconate dehydrogenase
VTKLEVGLFGLGVMGRNLALNWRDKGVCVHGYDTNPAVRKQFASDDAGISYSSPSDLIAAIPRPRIVCLLIPAGEQLCHLVEELMPLLEAGDVMVDAGNSHYRQTESLQAKVAQFGISLVGLGVSGGERGARLGPAVMAGGAPAAVATIRPLFELIAAVAEDYKPCFTNAGIGGAGHFVKMMHNGIEYADMQSIAEAVYLMRHLGGLGYLEIADVLLEWNRGELESYLIEISAEVLSATDEEDGLPLLDKISDVASQNGTGRWALIAALELEVSAPCIAAAVFARIQSACLAERIQLEKLPKAVTQRPPLKEFLFALHETVVGARLAAFSQGFSVISAASQKYHWNIDLSELALGWRSGCIVRSRLLDTVASSIRSEPNLSNILMSKVLGGRMAQVTDSWRSISGIATECAIPVPVIASGLTWYDIFICGRLWTDMIQGQRDCFGAHGFQRVDRLGLQHHRWRNR